MAEEKGKSQKRLTAYDVAVAGITLAIAIVSLATIVGAAAA